ncbi:MAG: YlbF family regulator [Lachnospiraceae bacterium]|nr:YlbF family regulator [Lachnospiraceae bacterium]
MDMIQLAREIGKEIQQDESYIKMRLAQQVSEEDEELQNLVGEFNLKRMAINNEASKTERNEEKIEELNKEFRHIYAQIMQNEKMTAYNTAKQEFDMKLQRVLAIINNSADGDNPETTDYSPSCTGSCSTCGGCH